MITKIQNWGNSQGIKIPKSILNLAHFSTDEELIVTALKGKIVLESARRHKTLQERLKNYDGDYQCFEWDIEKNGGNEME